MDEINTRYTPEQWVNHYQKNYVDTLTLDAATRIIKNDMTNMVRTCVSIGFHLKAVRDKELFQDAGYENIWEYASDQFGLSISSASRYMTINDMFSVGGNTPQLQEEYRNFSKSQLQEMITMSDEQRQQVTEEMTVKEIRKIKNPEPELEPKTGQKEEEQIPRQMEVGDYPGVLPEESVATSQQQAKENNLIQTTCPPGIPECIRQEWGTSPEQQHEGQEECAKCWVRWKKLQSGDVKNGDGSGGEKQEEQPLSVYGLPIRTYPPGSLLTTPGCGTLETGGVHDCSSCHMDGCRIRQKECYCVEAPMGNPFPCTTLNVVECLREDVGDRCQFVNHGLAFHRAGDGEPVPCCKNCGNPCGYECRRSANQRPGQKQEEEGQQGVPKRAVTILTYLAEAVLAEKDLDTLLSHSENKEDFFGQIRNLLFSESVDFEFSNTELRAEFFSSIEIIKISTGQEIGAGYTWDQFFEELNYVGNIYESDQEAAVGEKPESEIVDADFREVEACCESAARDPAKPKSILEEEKKKLDEYLEAFKDEKPEDIPQIVEKQKIIVAALAGMVCDLESLVSEPEPEQPDLPAMKNNDQRKEWLRNYKDWGLWYEDYHIGARYYKYEFENGATLIAEEYDCANPYVGEYTTSYLHLVGGPEPPKNGKYGYGKWQRNERYNRYPNNETELVEFLKEVQKSGK